MNRITETLPAFRQALYQGESIMCNSTGDWWVQSRSEQVINTLLFRRSSCKKAVIAAFNRTLDNLEHYHCANTTTYLETGRLLQRRFSTGAVELDRRLLALEYREGRRHAAEVPVEDLGFFKRALEWKFSLDHSPNGALDRKQYEQLRKTFDYPKFITLLNKEKKLTDQFFQWTIVNRCDPRIFIEYPALATKIAESKFASRVGRYNLIQFEGDSILLRGELGEYLDLRNPNATLTLTRGYTVDFNEICEQFKVRDIRCERLEACSIGVINWSPAHFGRWSPESQSYDSVDFRKTDWWEQLEPDEVLSPKKLQEQYKLKILPDGKQWVFLLAASSESSDHVLVGGTHGYLVACIPNSKGEYGVFPFGKYAKGEFPTTLREKLHLVFNYTSGAILYPDQNVSLTDRDNEYLGKETSEEVGREIMEDIRRDIIHSFTSEMPFQLFQNNCMHWAQQKLDRLLTDEEKRLSFIHPPHSQMRGPWKISAAVFNLIPRAITAPLLNMIAAVFGAYKPYSWKTRDGDVRVSHYMAQTPWSAGGYQFPNPSTFLLRRRFRQAS